MLGERTGSTVPFANSADYVTAIPRVRLAAVPGASHLPQEEAVPRSPHAVEQFLAGD